VRRVSLVSALFAVLCSNALALVAGDEIYLRDGRIWTGSVVRESSADYTFVPSSSGPTRSIPRDAVRYVLYADDAKAARALGLEVGRKPSRESAVYPVRILTAEGLGQASLAAARKATSSVWMSGYAFSGSLEGAIGAFYAVLAAKAKEGVEVVIVAEYGQATPPSVKQATRKFVHEMARHGVHVYLHSQWKALHKKLLIVDGRTVFLGSSNFTSAGTLYNQDLNIAVDSPDFARKVMADFQDIKDRSVALEKWKDR